MGDTMPGRSSRFAALLFTACALGLAVATGWLILQLFAQGGHTEKTPIVVAAQRIEAGHPFKPEDLRVVPWPSESTPRGSFGDPRALLTPIPRVPTSGLFEGEPVLEQRLASPQAGPGLAALVTPMRRAVAVRVDRELAASHLVYPGAHVDVVATLHSAAGSVVTSRTVIQDVRVLAVGSFADIEAVRHGDSQRASGADNLAPGPDDGQDVVTLEVLPQDAELLSLVVREGKIDLALRNATDHEMDLTGGVTSQQALGGTHKRSHEGAAAAPADRPAPTGESDQRPARRSRTKHGMVVRAPSEHARAVPASSSLRGPDVLPTP